MNTSVTEPEQRTRRFRLPSFGVQVLIGLVLGVALGLVARSIGADGVDASTGEVDPNWLTETLSTVGGTFVTLLRAVVPPLVFLAIVASIANLRDVTGAARLAWKTLAWFAITALIAVSIGIVLGLVLRPGDHTSVTSDAASAPSSTGSWLDFLTGLVPANVLGLEGYDNGDGTRRLLVQRAADPRHRDRRRHRHAQGRRGRRPVPRLRPLGARRRAEGAVVDHPARADRDRRPARQRGRQLRLGRAQLARARSPSRSTPASLLVLLGVYPVLLRLNGLSVKQFFSGAWPAISLAFVSRSSVGTMPVTESVTERNLGVPRAYASFAVPLGATTKMDGCASIYPAISAIFVAQFFGLDLSITDYVLIAFVSVIGSAATAGVTGATVMLTLTLSTLGLPLEGVGLLLAIDPILDMGRTAVNVAGQALVPDHRGQARGHPRPGDVRRPARAHGLARGADDRRRRSDQGAGDGHGLTRSASTCDDPVASGGRIVARPAALGYWLPPAPVAQLDRARAF